MFDGSQLALLRAVAATSLFAVSNAECIAGNGAPLGSEPQEGREHDHRESEQWSVPAVVSFTWKVNRDFFTVRQAYARDLAERRVRLLWGHRSDLQADALFLRAFFEHDRLGLVR